MERLPQHMATRARQVNRMTWQEGDLVRILIRPKICGFAFIPHLCCEIIIQNFNWSCQLECLAFGQKIGQDLGKGDGSLYI